MYIVGDIGGTKTRVAVSEDFSNFKTPDIFPTAQDPDEGIKHFVEAAHTATGGAAPQYAVVGIPGILKESRDELFRSPHLPKWENVALRKKLEAGLGCPVFLQNDTALVGLGEAHFGAGRGFSILGYITISTGVGGVRIVDGAIEKTVFGFEPGHHLLTIGNHTMELENIIGGATLEKEYHQTPTDIKNPELWDELHKILAQELYNIILDWSPECIVLGGSLVKEGGFDVARVDIELQKLNTILPKLPAIKRAELGTLGGLYGGLMYIRQHTFNQ